MTAVAISAINVICLQNWSRLNGAVLKVKILHSKRIAYV